MKTKRARSRFPGFEAILRGFMKMGIGWLVLVIVLWVLLQAYILPKFGVST
jgi:hypothetical protein